MASRDVTDAELAILQLLWDRGDATVRALTDALYPGGGASCYGTVQKLLQRLEAKSYVSRVANRTPLVFTPNVARDEIVDGRLEEIVDKLCAGSLLPILSHVGYRRKLTAKQRRELHDFVDQLAQRRPRGKRS